MLAVRGGGDETRILLGRLVGLGLTMGACVGIGVLVGVWVDRRLDISPTFTLIGFFLGLIAAFRELFRVVRLLEKENETRSGPNTHE